MCMQICCSQQSYDDFLKNLKLKDCPFCKRLGTLNRHGFLRGHDDRGGQQKRVRAQRVFCSNRNGAAGCGKTFSVSLADILKRSFLTSTKLWKFLQLIVQGVSKAEAFRSLHCDSSDSAPYHVWRRFLNAQSAIRTSLFALGDPPSHPPDGSPKSPAHATLAHLKAVFAEHPLDPISAFQATLNVAFI